MPSKLRRRLFYYLPRLRYFIIGTLLGIIVLGLVKIVPPTFDFLKKFSFGPAMIWSVITDPTPRLKETEGRTNILLLGRAGGDHDGADLTDTIIFLSVNLKTSEITLISLPRDIWAPSLKDRINTAYEIGEGKRKGGGLILSKAIVSDLLNQPVHYAVLIDFSGFKKMVDLLGGLQVDVENSFDDYKYPIEGKENDLCDGDPEFSCRHEHLHFDKGTQFMDGERVLKYVRSRQAEGEEGTDFARSKRQQKVLLSLKNKILARETLLNPGKILSLEKLAGESIVTDIQTSEFDDFLKIARSQNLAKMRTLTLDTGDKNKGRDGLLINPPISAYNGAWVLAPRSGDWQEIQSYIKSQLQTAR